MILTDKCKTEFEKYVESLEVAPYVVMLDSIPQTYLHALIIEWFSTLKELDWERIFYVEYRATKFLNSKLATTKAITKANSLFNQLAEK